MAAQYATEGKADGVMLHLSPIILLCSALCLTLLACKVWGLLCIVQQNRAG